MDTIRVVVSGSGKMGRQVGEAVAAEGDLLLLAYVDGLAQGNTFAGLPLYRDAATCFASERPDVVIDFTNAAWTPVLAKAALDAGVRLVIGTTGLDAAFMARLEAESAKRKVGAVVAANYAIGAVLMMHFARQAARFFDAAEIIELHHDQKVDSPSGTAKTTAELMRAARETPFNHVVSEKEPLAGARGAEYGGIAIHSVRLPGFVAHQEVIFGGLGQTLTIRHDTTGRDSFMPGVIAATREVMKLDHLVVGLDRLFGLT
jgi:4-hydroxy-tetrahydrodipicolinate reductase